MGTKSTEYRDLISGELIRAGDEFKSHEGDWRTTGNDESDGIRVGNSGYQYRRKVDSDPAPGKGYRWVLPGEPVMPTDEAAITSTRWVNVAADYVGRPCPYTGQVRRSKAYIPVPKVPDGFKLLAVGDIAIYGDKWFNGTEWVKTLGALGFGAHFFTSLRMRAFTARRYSSRMTLSSTSPSSTHLANLHATWTASGTSSLPRIRARTAWS